MNSISYHLQWLQWSLLSLIAGALTTLAFAPFDLSWLVFLTLAVAFYFWNKLPAKQAAMSAWLFALGLQGTGVSWIFHSIHTHGNAPVLFAVFLVFLLCCVLSIFTALSAYSVNRYLPNKPVLRLILFYPASWVVFEWLQGYLFTGFAWMQLGYTQIDLPLSGFAPIFGSHAVSGFVAISAGALVLLIQQSVKQSKQLKPKYSLSVTLPAIFLSVALLWLAGAGLKTVSWTEKAGDAIKVSVVQGNIAQKDKWKPQMKQLTLDRYRELTLAQQDIDLFVWPETAIPAYLHRVTPYIQQLRHEMKQRDADLLLGIFVKNDENRVLNSTLNIHGDIYHKRHLVPLGEYVPFRFLMEFFNRFVDIPMSDIDSGADEQALLVAAGVPLGITICFEEAFARNVIRDLPEAKLLINMSNDAWFEDSHQPHQHHAIARMRALETGRYMIRATNTGITSLIGPHGEVIKQLPQFEIAVLNGEVQPLSGATPFVRLGDWLIVGLCVLLLLGFGLKREKVKV